MTTKAGARDINVSRDPGMSFPVFHCFYSTNDLFTITADHANLDDYRAPGHRDILESCDQWRTSTVKFTNSTVDVRHRSHDSLVGKRRTLLPIPPYGSTSGKCPVCLWHLWRLCEDIKDAKDAKMPCLCKGRYMSFKDADCLWKMKFHLSEMCMSLWSTSFMSLLCVIYPNCGIFQLIFNKYNVKWIYSWLHILKLRCNLEPLRALLHRHSNCSLALYKQISYAPSTDPYARTTTWETTYI